MAKMRHSPSRTSRSPQGPSLAQRKVGPGLSPQPPLVVHCGLCLGLGRWGLPEYMLTSQDLDPSPTPGAAGSIWGNHLEPERGLDVSPGSQGVFIYIPSLTSSGHPVLSQDKRAVCHSSSSTPSQHLEDYPQRWDTLPGSVYYVPTPCPCPGPQAHPAVQVMVISVHRPGTLPSTFTHYFMRPSHAGIYSWELRRGRFRIAQEPRT